MRNLLQFILKHSNFLLFLALEVVAFLLVLFSGTIQQSAVLTSANYVVGSINEKHTQIHDYFSLREQNAVLEEENADLRNEIERLRSFQEPTIEKDSAYLYSHLRSQYVPAKVIDLTIHQQHNRMTINRGHRDLIESDMGVITHDGVVGVTKAVSEHFATVIPLIHTQLHLSCRLRSNNQLGSLRWDGKNYRYAYLDDVASHVHVIEGDTVVTSGLTSVFPADIMVGVVDRVSIGEGDSYYTIRIRLAVDYKAVNYVQIISSPLKKELNGLD